MRPPFVLFFFDFAYSFANEHIFLLTVIAVFVIIFNEGLIFMGYKSPKKQKGESDNENTSCRG